MRIFTALPVPTSVQHYLGEVAESAAFFNPEVPINWVARDTFHITLHFLGDIEADQLNLLTTTLGSLTPQLAAFSLSLDGVSAFPDLADPRVVMVRVADKAYKARELEALLNHTLMGLGFKMPEVPWQPHITLGRVKPCTHPEPFVLPDKPVTPLEWQVNEVQIIESVLTREGTKYSILASVPLA